MAALSAVTLALNPITSPTAYAAASPAAVSRLVGAHALYLARREIGVPYKWGGTSPRTGFDCSGLTQWAYYRAGVHTPRTAEQQYLATIHIPVSARRPGDLVFFFSDGSAYHVGMFVGGWTMIDAPYTGTRVQQELIWNTSVRFGRVR